MRTRNQHVPLAANWSLEVRTRSLKNPTVMMASQPSGGPLGGKSEPNYVAQSASALGDLASTMAELIGS